MQTDGSCLFVTICDILQRQLNPFVAAPLVKIKQALLNIKKDITQMDIRTGVLEHHLLQAKLKDKSNNAHSSSIEAGLDD